MNARPPIGALGGHPRLPLPRLLQAVLTLFLPLSTLYSQAQEPLRNLDPLVSEETIWETTPEAFEKKLGNAGLQWLDAEKSRVRFFGRGLRLFGGIVRPLEVNCDFKGGKLAATSVFFYNRGDSPAHPANQAELERWVSAYRDLLTAQLGVKPIDRGKDAASVVKANGWLWQRPPSLYVLEYSFEREVKALEKPFSAEFIRLKVTPLPKRSFLSEYDRGTVHQPLTKASLVKNVATLPQGDVLLRNIPMVDQGPKGYCVVATCERIFRYLGLEVDQHEMAAIAESSAQEGTDFYRMKEGLKRLTGRLKVHLRDLNPGNFEEFQKTILDYNRLSKRKKKREVNLPDSGVIRIEDLYASLDPELLKESKTTLGKVAYSKFQRQIAETIGRGVPVMWTVQLGLYPEPERTDQTRGGHMRLIIGYNPRTSEILYSDSWGAAHALKRMPMEEAFAMTTGMYFVEPNQ
ncbi:MAG: hypothetical protein RLZZ399_2814 [Verrucomicrobiota bacterium]|jgi:hypothetical protein